MQRFIERYFLFLFGAGFVLISLMPLLIVVQSIKRAGLGADAFIGAWMMSLFLGFAIAVLFLAWHTLLAEKKKEAASARWPDQPWRWRDDWQNKEVVHSPWPMTWFKIGFAGFVSYLIGGACFVFMAKNADVADGQPGANVVWWALSLLLAAACCLVVAACKAIVSARKWGKSQLALQQVPTGLNEPFIGRVWLQSPLKLDNRVTVTICCWTLRNDHSKWRGNDVGQASVWQAPIWSESRSVKSFLPTGDPNRVCIPVAFDIPPDLPGTHQQERTEWKLEVQSQRGWIPYSAEFEIPIFGITRKNEVATQSAQSHPFAEGLEKPVFKEMVTDRNGNVVSNMPSRLELDFGMADRKQAAVVIVGASAIASILMSFSYLMGAAGALIALGAIGEALATTRIVLDDTHLHRRRAVLGIGMTRRYLLTDIESFTSTIEAEPNGTSKCVRLTAKSGKMHTIIDRIASHAIGSVIAEHLNEHIKQHHGVTVGRAQ